MFVSNNLFFEEEKKVRFLFTVLERCIVSGVGVKWIPRIITITSCLIENSALPPNLDTNGRVKENHKKFR